MFNPKLQDLTGSHSLLQELLHSIDAQITDEMKVIR